MLLGKTLHDPQPQAANSTQPTPSAAGAQGIAHSDKALDPHRLRDLTLVGVGSSVAYLANELTRRFAADGPALPLRGKVSIIGQEDPWSANVRGQGYINHQHEIIDQWGPKAPAYNPAYADRGEFAASNQAQLERAKALGAEHLPAQITSISQLKNGTYHIQLENGQAIESRQVVLGMGAGPHTRLWNTDGVQTQAEQRLGNIRPHQQEALQGKVLDLDEFMRATDSSPEQFAGKRVVVHGPNAGIDAVERAGELGAHVNWMIRSTKPVLLDGHQLKFAPEVARNNLVSVDELDIYPNTAPQGSALRLNYSAPGDDPLAPRKTLDADYYVYALGQDIHKPGSAGAILGDLLGKLEPVYDYDQVYSDQPYKTVVGLQSRGSDSSQGLVVVGAAVAQLAANVQHSYLDHAAERIFQHLEKLPGFQGETLSRLMLDGASRQDIQTHLHAWAATTPSAPAVQVLHNQVSDYLAARDYFQQQAAKKGTRGVVGEVENQTLNQVASVVVSPQLGTVKASTAALSGLMPAYVANGENNFTMDDRTMLRAGIADRYPNIDNARASQFIEDVMDLRHLGSQAFINKANAEGASQAPVQTPVVGVPAPVREGYEAQLEALNNGADNEPLSRQWERAQ
ncbi:restriction endonuclease [Pseudomonas sp. Bout1]|uniref:restriction endonuclease n=1 Tax=Pseudomonas sp. Bout1 TaxID=3048600 RepID=UPI002AB42E6A|nr:restriction endonuclease [Pseudomonas sp. Bout1]MDY7531642.1 restriction endonuclease [Pseudomonas sp. Bout1]MEB0186565.1 restriction endonuclease [Pseudomonas sp. Bout1]